MFLIAAILFLIVAVVIGGFYIYRDLDSYSKYDIDTNDIKVEILTKIVAVLSAVIALICAIIEVV
jgi:purine-cytosine permease-like protein